MLARFFYSSHESSERPVSDMDDIRIVLVEPSHPGNIGGTARAMKTMGLKNLVVVNPRRFPDPQADWRAAGALDVLDAARVVASVEEAIADCHWVVGTSTRLRKIPWPVSDARQVAQQIRNLGDAGKAAILFGREDNGLTNEELRRCNHHLQIPASPEYPSLNLAMAVQVVCYEIHSAFLETSEDVPWDRRLATSQEVANLLEHMETVLTQHEFLDAENPGQTMTRLRRLFARAGIDETEVQILRGIFKHFDRRTGQ